MLVSACGSSHPTASTSNRASSGASATPASSGLALAPSATPAPAAAPTPAPAPVSPAATPTASVNPGGPNAASTQTCAYKAAHDQFIEISQAQPASGGALTVTGHAATIVCGGPDDFHFNVATAAETLRTLPTASIITFPTSQMKPEPIQASQLAAYLKTDGDTRIFLIAGPLSAMTLLQEQYHP